MRKRLVFAAIVTSSFLAAAVVGCSGSDNASVAADGGDEEGDSAIDAGHTRDSGTRSDSGAREASVPDSGSSSDAGVTHGNPDGGNVVTVPDSGVVVDSGTVIVTTLDAGADSGTLMAPDGGTASCFMPQNADYVVSTGPMAHQNRCNGATITSIYTTCFGPSANATDCAATQAANADCFECVFGGGADGGAGPSPVVLPYGSLDIANQSGCLAAVSTTATPACKVAYEDVSYCADTACSTCDTTSTAADDCVSAAETDPSSICEQDFGIDSVCETSVDDISAVDAQNECGFGLGTFEEIYTAIATSMCGP